MDPERQPLPDIPQPDKRQRGNIVFSMLRNGSHYASPTRPIPPGETEDYLQLVASGEIGRKHYRRFLRSIRRGQDNDDPNFVYDRLNDPNLNSDRDMDGVRGLLAHFTRGHIRDRHMVGRQDMALFLTLPEGRNVLAFEDSAKVLLDRLNTEQGPQGRARRERMVQRFGILVYGKQWEYLQQIRLLEAEASSTPDIGQRQTEVITPMRDLPARAVLEKMAEVKDPRIERDKEHIASTLRAELASFDGRTVESMIKRFGEEYQSGMIAAREDPGRFPAIETVREDLLEMAIKGTLRGEHAYNTDVVNEMRESVGLLMEIYRSNPKLAEAIAAHHIQVAHGSGSASLAGVFNVGLRPQLALEEQGQLIAGGEGVFGAANLNQKNISTVWWHTSDRLRDYAITPAISEESLTRRIRSLERDLADNTLLRGLVTDRGQAVEGSIRHSMQITLENQRRTLAFLQKPGKTPAELLQENLIRLNFPTIYFLSAETVRKKREPSAVDFDQEITIAGGAAKDEFPILLVPENRTKWVREYAEECEVPAQIFPIEDYSFSPN